MVLARLPGIGRPGAQVGADRADVADALVGGGPGQQGAGFGLELQGQTGAAVAFVVPFQGHYAAAGAQVRGTLSRGGPGKAGQQSAFGAKAVGRGAVDAGPIIQNFG